MLFNTFVISQPLLQVKEITTVTRTTITTDSTATTAETKYPTLTVTAADTTAIPDFTTTTDSTAGESLIMMNRNFIKSMETVADPSC